MMSLEASILAETPDRLSEFYNTMYWVGVLCNKWLGSSLSEGEVASSLVLLEFPVA